ncbi:MAG: 2-aminoethylphosphonate--pyruvate transaminase [Lactobacillus sp.]|nr:2-aminoethylphosphonate--pyruvate transaminase [Lactobacillus sp.]
MKMLLTPGPISTTDTVKRAMLADYGTWDSDYLKLTEKVRSQLVAVANGNANYASILLQGSGTYAVEATLGSAIPKQGAVLLLAINGAYGQRMAEIADYLGIPHINVVFEDTEVIDPAQILKAAADHPEITHFAMVHCETTTGILNPIEAIIPNLAAQGIVTIVDAMSSFGGVPLNVVNLGVDYVISSANKCLQGEPGIGFVIAKQTTIAKTRGNARSLALDLFDQYDTFEKHPGKWRFTSPTQVLAALAEALQELKAEGGVQVRYQRYITNQRSLSAGMATLGYEPLLDATAQSPIITTFRYPDADFDFQNFYDFLKKHDFLIYPGKLTEIDSFRVGNIGAVYETDIARFLSIVKQYDGATVAKKLVK